MRKIKGWAIQTSSGAILDVCVNEDKEELQDSEKLRDDFLIPIWISRRPGKKITRKSQEESEDGVIANAAP